MATPKFNSKSPTIRRILKEAAEISSSPSPDYTATPLETDLFEWHFTMRGPPHSAFAEGIYHGRIVLPPTYPLRPPMFRFTTPSGRFEANREKIAAMYDERFCRMFEFYLISAETMFTTGSQLVFHMQLARKRDAAPIVRDYVTDVQREYKAKETERLKVLEPARELSPV